MQMSSFLEHIDPEVLECCENDLAAAAAGLPGAWDDSTIYTRLELLQNPYGRLALEQYILKEHGRLDT